MARWWSHQATGSHGQPPSRWYFGLYLGRPHGALATAARNLAGANNIKMAESHAGPTSVSLPLSRAHTHSLALTYLLSRYLPSPSRCWTGAFPLLRRRHSLAWRPYVGAPLDRQTCLVSICSSWAIVHVNTYLLPEVTWWKTRCGGCCWAQVARQQCYLPPTLPPLLTEATTFPPYRRCHLSFPHERTLPASPHRPGNTGTSHSIWWA